MKAIGINELTEARLEIEKVVLSHAIDHADESDLRSLKENVTKARNKIKKNMRATEENFEFHSLLARASKNPVFVITVESIMALHANFISRLGFDYEVSKNVVTFHEDILKALEEKRRDEAIHLFEEHMLEVKNRLQPLVKDEGTGSNAL